MHTMRTTGTAVLASGLLLLLCLLWAMIQP